MSEILNELFSGTDDNPTMDVKAPPQNDRRILDALMPDEGTMRLYDGKMFSRRANPDAAARILNIQAKTGLPAEVILRNLNEIEKDTEASDFDFEKFRVQNPVVSKWISENPAYYALSKDDTGNLSYLERQAAFIKNQFDKGKVTVEMSKLGSKAVDGTASAEDEARIAELQKFLKGVPDTHITGFVEQVPGMAANQIPIFLESLKGKIYWGAEGMATGAAAGAMSASRLPAPPVTKPGVVAAGAASGALAGLTMGWRHGAAIAAGQMEMNLAYLDYRDMKDENGHPLDRQTALGAAAVTGIINGALEGLLGVEALVDKLPGIRQFSRSGIKELLRSPTVRKAFLEYAKNLGSTMTTEGATEFVQSMVTNAMGAIATGIQDGSIADTQGMLAKIFSDKNIQQALEEGRAGMQGAGGMATVLAMPGAAADYKEAKKAKATEEAFKALGDGVKATEMNERAPTQMHEVLQRLYQDGPIPNVYIPLEAWDKHWSKNGVEPREVAKTITGDYEAYDRAKESGSDLVVPTAAYAKGIGPTSHNSFFASELRGSPDAMNSREAEEFAKRMDEATKEIVDRAMAEEANKQSVGDIVQEQLMKSGFSEKDAGRYASLYNSVFNALGARTGRDPVELLRERGLSIGREFDGLTEEQLTEGAKVLPVAPLKSKQLSKGTGIDVPLTKAELNAQMAEALGLPKDATPEQVNKAMLEQPMESTKPLVVEKPAPVQKDLSKPPVERPTEEQIAAENEKIAKKAKKADAKKKKAEEENKAKNARTRMLIRKAYNVAIGTPDIEIDDLRKVANMDYASGISQDVPVSELPSVIERKKQRNLGDFVDPNENPDTKPIHTEPNVMSAGNVQELKDALGLPKEASLEDVITAAQAAGFNGVTMEEKKDGPDTGSAAPVGERNEKPQVVLRTVQGGDPKQGWAGATRIRGRDGKPRAFHRGSSIPLDAAHFLFSAFGKNTTHPSAGLGVWFTADKKEAGTYGTVGSFYLDMRNPLLIRVEDLPGFDTVEGAYAWRQQQIEAGYDGLIIDGTHLGGRQHLVAFTADQVIQEVESDSLDFTTLNQDERGKIEFNAEGTQFNIRFLENADMSTFLHESGHFFLEVMQRLAVTNDGIAHDLEILKEWMKTDVIGPEHHEQFARAFEAYLMEGKSPNTDIQSAFDRFRLWLLGVYKVAVNLNVRINDEIRGVFDRLIATDEQIAAAKEQAQIMPLFLDAAKAEMSDIEFAAYRDRIAKSSMDARDALQSKLMRQFQRERTKWWKEKLEEIRKHVEGEANGSRVYLSLAFLQSGKLPNGENLPEGITPFKLDRDALLDEFGEDFVGLLPKIHAVGGMDLKDAAQFLGYATSDDMIKELSESIPKAQFVKEEARKRMLATYGGIEQDGSVADKAMDAIMNDKREEVIMMELGILKRLLRESAPAVKAAKKIDKYERQNNLQILKAMMSPAVIAASRAAAAKYVAGLLVRDLNPGFYLQNMRRAAKEAVLKTTKGDFESAIKAKEQELLNFHLFRAVEAAQKDTIQMAAYARSLQKVSVMKRMGKAGGSYLEQVQAILDRFSFGRVDQKQIAQKASLMKFVEQQAKAGAIVNIPDKILNEAYRRNYKELTYEEMESVVDTLKQIDHVSKLKTKLLKSARTRELGDAVNEILTSLKEHFTGKEQTGFRETHLPHKEGMRSFAGFFASHRKLSNILRWMDGYKDNGIMWQYFLLPLNNAASEEAAMRATATVKMKALMSGYSAKEKAMMGFPRNIPGTDIKMSKMGQLAVALNVGNADNRIKLMEGYGWKQDQLDKILDGLDQRDWDFVQGMWDYLEEFWPQVAEKERRVSGLPPKKVQATVVKTKFGDYRGGYYPIKYDPRQSPRAYGDLVKVAAEASKRGAYTRAATSHGHLIARMEGVNEDGSSMKIRLDFSVFLEHTNQLIHDLTHHETLMDLARLLGDQTVSQDIINKYGDVIYHQIHDTITDIAAGEIPSQAFVEKSLNWLRRGSSVASMGWKLTTALIQPAGLAQSMVRIGPKWVAIGVGKWLRNASTMEKTLQMIQEKSPFMRTRALTQNREISEIRNAVKLSGPITPVTDSFFWMIHKMQLVADIPTWLGAYEKYAAQNLSEDRVIALADQAVIDSQGAGQIKDLAAVQRGTPALKLWTNFYSYFNVTYNLTKESFGRTNFKSPLDVGMLAGDLLLLYVVPAVISVMLRDALKGEEPDDDDELALRILREIGAYALGTVLLARELGGAALGYYGYSGPAGARAFEELGGLAREAAQGELDQGLLKRANTSAGVLFHYPAGQIQTTIDGYVAWSEDKAPITALAFGPPKEK